MEECGKSGLFLTCIPFIFPPLPPPLSPSASVASLLLPFFTLFVLQLFIYLSLSSLPFIIIFIIICFCCCCFRFIWMCARVCVCVCVSVFTFLVPKKWRVDSVVVLFNRCLRYEDPALRGQVNKKQMNKYNNDDNKWING